MSIPSSSSWRAYDWQLIQSAPIHPVMHMALDEALLEEVAAGRRKPTLRIWEWAASAVVIGRFQSLRNEVDLESARRYQVQVVRRITGGGAMFIEPGNTITYSIYAPVELVAGMSMVDSYAFCDRWVLDALASLGVEAWYQPINDITSSSRQDRRGGANAAQWRGTAPRDDGIRYRQRQDAGDPADRA
jgi:lipoate-protein ligase A